MQPDEILDSMSDTFNEREKTYGDNWKRIGPVLKAMFPDGIHINDADTHNAFHVFMMMMVKMTRLAVMDLNHQDSAHDIAVYAAMLESLIIEKESK